MVFWRAKGWIVLLLLAAAGGWAYFQMARSSGPVRIGFAAGLTGIGSELGVNGRNGVMLAVREANRKGGIRGRSIELLVADDKNDAQTALAADKFLAGRGCVAIIGHMTSAMAELTVPFANESKLLLISPTISTEDLSGKDDYFVRVIPSNAVQGESLARVVQRSGVRNVAVIYDAKNLAFSKPMIQTFESRMQGAGLKLSQTEAFQNQAEFPQLVRNVARGGGDGVLLIASALDAAMFNQQMKKAGIGLPVFLPMWSMTDDLITSGGNAVEGVYLINQEDMTSETEAFLRFRRDYVREYGREPTFAAILGYDAATVLFAGMADAEALTADGIKAAILRRGSFPGLQRDIAIDRYGDAGGKYFLYRVRDGAFVKEGSL